LVLRSGLAVLARREDDRGELVHFERGALVKHAREQVPREPGDPSSPS
jgi:hypothetical protein